MEKLKLVTFVSIFFIIAQCIGGYLSNSIAIYTDSAHLATDLIGFAMSITAIKMSQQPSCKKYTYGWHRAEIIGTMMSVVFLITITMWLFFEATNRLLVESEVKGKQMLITAILGLIFNLIQMKILHQGDAHYHLGGESHCHSHKNEEAHNHEAAHNHEEDI